MIRAPTLREIYAAELRFAQARQNTRDGLHRVRIAFRATLARPTTWALAAATTGLLGYWLIRRRRQVPVTSRAQEGVDAKTASAGGILLAFIMRYAMRQIPFILRRFLQARRDPAATGA